MISVKDLHKSFGGVTVLDGISTQVERGDVVCIIEAMKLMNEIMAELDGEIVEVCVQNGQVVDFGCPLFRIKGQ